ncbi:hypothetical protein ACQKDD_08230 [Planococcus kocurii]|uniref:hypothetical protein n=1 Tax=Planococcus kocurii TaxID=1374 RepID=UPI003D07825A
MTGVAFFILAKGGSSMNKILASAILGMGVTGAVLILSVAQLFNPSSDTVWKILTAGSAMAFVVLAISALTLRRRLDKKTN